MLEDHNQLRRWKSRSMFLIAAIGSAIGFGNVWRFPYLVHKYGGGTFLVPYFFALFVFGIPLLVLEVSLGQLVQHPTLEVFQQLFNKWQGVAWAAVVSGYLITVYYCCLLGWTMIYMLVSLESPLPWVHNAQDYFEQSVLHRSASINEVSYVVPRIAGALFVAWLIVWLGLLKGAKSIERLNTITMPLPIIILGILLARGATLPGAMIGFRKLFEPDLSLLFNANIWTSAFTQILFTLSLGNGIMTTYASYSSNTDPNLISNCFIVALSNAMFSIVAATSLFCFLGHLAHEEGVSIDDVMQSGPGLTFIVFPQVLLLLPASNLFSFLFFVMLLCLGLSSAVSMVEPIIVSLQNWKGGQMIAIPLGIGSVLVRVTHRKIVTVVCLTGYLLGLIIATDAGYYWLELMDLTITKFATLTVGGLECIVLLRHIRANKHVTEPGSPVQFFQLRFVSNTPRWNAYIQACWYAVPVILLILFGIECASLTKRGGFENFPQWAVFVGMVLSLSSMLLIPLCCLFPHQMSTGLSDVRSHVAV